MSIHSMLLTTFLCYATMSTTTTTSSSSTTATTATTSTTTTTNAFLYSYLRSFRLLLTAFTSSKTSLSAVVCSDLLLIFNSIHSRKRTMSF